MKYSANDTVVTDLTTTVIQSFTPGLPPATDSEMVFYSDNSLLGGGTDGLGNYENIKVYDYYLEIFLQQGTAQYLWTKGRQNITL